MLSIHELMGVCVDTLFKILSKSVTYKNMSIIMLAFRNVEEMLADVLQEEELDLPYCGARSGSGMLVMKGDTDTDICENTSTNVDNTSS